MHSRSGFQGITFNFLNKMVCAKTFNSASIDL